VTTDWRRRVAEIAQAEFEDSLTEAGHVAHAEHLGERIAIALTEMIGGLRAEIEEGDALRERMADLLTGTANALKGDPPPLTWHDWSDLPAVAKKAAAAAAEKTQE
jgi:hypothetical protein